MKLLRLVAGLTVGVVVSVSGVAYATGYVPSDLMPAGLLNDAWISKNCEGQKFGRDAKCPDPTTSDSSTLPDGSDVLVAFGDSYSSGEGAASDEVYKIQRPAEAKLRMLGLQTLCEGASADKPPFSGTDPCMDYPREIWVNDTGFVEGTDQANPRNTCHKSKNAYSSVVAQRLHLKLDLRACSGAVLKDYWQVRSEFDDGDKNKMNHQPGSANTLLDPQSEAPIPERTRVVTAGFGGNDVHFADLVKACIYSAATVQGVRAVVYALALEDIAESVREQAGGSWQTFSCEKYANFLTDQAPVLLNDPETGLQATFADIKNKANQIRYSQQPPPRVVALGYPRIFPLDPKGSCSLGTLEPILGPSEQRAINGLVTALNREIKAAATAAGIDYVDISDLYVPRAATAGTSDDHGMCQDQGPDLDSDNAERWINRFRLTDDSVNTDAKAGTAHPNARGHAATAELVLSCLDNVNNCGNHVEMQIQQVMTEQADRAHALYGSTDWKRLSFEAAGCATREEYIEGMPNPDSWAQAWDNVSLDKRRAELTGGGAADEVFTIFSCPTHASSGRTNLVVFDISGAQPTVLATLPEMHFSTAEVTTGDRTITIQGTIVGDGDAPCCPSYRGKVVYAWDGAQFVVSESEMAKTSQPILHEGLPDGGQYTLLQAGTRNDVLINELTDFTTAPYARQACIAAAVDVAQENGPWCNDYYYRQDDDVVRAVRVSEKAFITYIDNTGNERELPRDQLDDLEGLMQVGAPPVFAVRSSGGDIVELHQVRTNPAPSGTDLDGTVHGIVTAVDPMQSLITLDKVDWFQGEAARAACTEDGVAIDPIAWCNEYYFRNVNPALRVVPVAPGAVVSIAAPGGRGQQPGDLAAVAAQIASGGDMFEMVVAGGVVTELRQVYLP